MRADNLTDPAYARLPSGRAGDYLEKLVLDGFKRELDQEENVVRSLPFFATSIGIMITLISLTIYNLPAADHDLWIIFIYGILVLLIADIFALLYFLHQAIRTRAFGYPMHEEDLLGYAKRLMSYYTPTPPASAADSNLEANTLAVVRSDTPGSDLDVHAIVERAVLEDLRNVFITQLATSAGISRRNNWARLKARSRAFHFLIMGLGFALVLICVMLFQSMIHGGSHGRHRLSGTEVAQPRDAGSEDGTGDGEAAAATDAQGREGLLDLRGSPGGRGGPQTGEEDTMSGKPVSPPATSETSQPADAAKPAPPPMNWTRKNGDDAGRETK